MIGMLMLKLFDSWFGSKVLQAELTEDGMKWTEVGIGRFLQLSFLLFWITIFGGFTVAFGLNPRYIISAIVLSLYMKEKITPFFVELFDELEKIDLERKQPLKERQMFKIIRNVFDGEGMRESIKQT